MCWCATPPGLCRATPRLGSISRPSPTMTARASWCSRALKVSSALELDDASICVQQGTTTELNLADFFRANHMGLKTVTFATGEDALKAYESGRCDAYTTDSSGLYGERLKLAEPERAASCCRRSSPRSRSARPCATATINGSTSCAGRTLSCSMPKSSASTKPMSTRN